jgi:hypothetical protein
VAALQRHVAPRKRNAGSLLATLFIAARARTTWASGLFYSEFLHAVKLQHMPVVFRYKSFRFFFCSNEGNPREAMHVYVRGSDGGAKFWLIPFLNRPCTLSASLAVRLYCRRFAFAFTND